MIRNAWSFSPERRKAAFRSGRFEVDTNSPQSAGLVGWWPLGVHSGNAKDWDYSGFKNHGTRTNGPVQEIVNHPRWGGVMALDFDGTDDYVDCGNISSTLFSADFTISLFMHPNETTILTEFLVMKEPAGSNGIGFFTRDGLGASGRLELRLDGVNNVSNDDVLTAQTWQMVTVTRLGSDISFFVDGIPVGTASSGTDGSSTGLLQIGQAEHIPGTITWNGLIDDLRIYDRGLSASIINQTDNEPWRLVYPLGVRTVSFAPVAVGTILPQITTAYHRINA